VRVGDPYARIANGHETHAQNRGIMDKRKMKKHDETTPWTGSDGTEVLSITWRYRRGMPLSFTFGPPMSVEQTA
jgi:hypothetical protein